MNKIVDFDDFLIQKYGERGTPEREKFEAETLAFRLGIQLKEERRKAKITQKQLAELTGTPQKEISEIERGQKDITLSQFQRLIQVGLGKQLNVSFC